MQRFYEETLTCLTETKNEVRPFAARSVCVSKLKCVYACSALKYENQSEIGQVVARQERVRSSNQGMLQVLHCSP